METVEDQLVLAEDTFVDAREFPARMATPPDEPDELLRVLDLYRDDFLLGFHLPDSSAFEYWVAVERERFRRLAVRGLTTLARLHGAAGDYRSALEALDRALSLNPLQEDRQREALRLHYLAGDRAGAIQRYDCLRRMLDEEMGVPPMDETRSLYDAIISDRLPRDPLPETQKPLRTQRGDRQELPSSRLPFAGRQLELAALEDTVRAHQLALIEGEPGIGKTRLAEEFLRTTDGLALVGAGRELESSLPYQPIIEALRGLLARPALPALRASLDLAPPWRMEVARLLPEILEERPGREPRAEESRLWESVNQLLLALAHTHTVIVFLDDVHRADEATLGLLGSLLHQSAGRRVGFLAAARPPSPRSPLATLTASLTRAGLLTRVPLARLQPEEVEVLADRLNPRPGNVQALARWLSWISEGNPLILAELVRHLRGSSDLRPDGTLSPEAWLASPVVPQTVFELIRTRLAIPERIAGLMAGLGRVDLHRGRLVGDLTIKDQTHSVTLDVVDNGTARSPWGTVSAGFTARGKINRKEWDLTWNQVLETGGVLVGEEIEVAIDLETVKQSEPEAAASAA